ncbi:probable transmembrane transport protein [Janibacter sp. HTCC2649]|uniref:carbohydrate ABC transporter permease n=1 Tax=Janibacter sp. HTCC2649 TaxID=313589 RepID=UPI000066EACA|nr:sugar ABC transporter permease [Janibacter sp. HTCC2649]EAP98948.1 probable transmembrane transport protein [Janibacter sp. HTCC2649]
MTAVVVPKSAKKVKVRRRRMPLQRKIFLLVTLGLPFAFYSVFVLWPFVQAFIYSLTNWSGFTDTFDFIGLENYSKLLQDDIFLKALRNNLLLALVVPFVTIVLALALATMVTVGGSSTGTVKGLSRSSIYRVVSFFPYTIPAIVIGLVWAQMFDPSSGLINAVLTGIGLDKFESFAWLGEVSTAMPVTMFVIVWGFVGFYMVLFIAAIKGIPAELYDAARVDGAGRMRMTMMVTLPMVRDTIQTAYIYLGILALDAFVYMAALNASGGPQNSTLTITQDLFNTAFKKGQFGMASAMGVVLALLTLSFAGIVFTINRFTGGKDR